jgi:hypothetical protein
MRSLISVIISSLAHGTISLVEYRKHNGILLTIIVILLVTTFTFKAVSFIHSSCMIGTSKYLQKSRVWNHSRT